MSHYEGDLRTPESARFAILASRWNARITDALVAGARLSLAGNGITEANIDVIRVPGAWELPLVAARLADVPGASAVLHGGVVAYQNAVKTGLLGVPEDLLARVGAVDADVARRMALGARAALGADVGVATTGVAGPEPHQGRPVGTVWLGLAVHDADANALDVLGGERDGAATAILLRLDGDRAAIREATVAAALQALTRLLAGRGH